jgi:predicted negative regulator of RcsB-dependent stress response
VSEYLNDDDRVQVLTRWWNENATALIVGLVLVIGGVIGWRWYTDHTAAREEAASAAYRSYVELRGSSTASPADRDAALATLDTEFPKTSYRIFSLLYRAHDAASVDDYEQAARWLETALAATDDELLRDVARVRLARLYVQLGKPDVALETLRQVKGSGFRSYVAEIKGDILLGQGKAAEAREAYQAAAAAADRDTDTEHPVLKMKLVDLATPNAPTP